MTLPRGVVLGRAPKSTAGASTAPARHYPCVHRGWWGTQPADKPGRLVLTCQAGRERVCGVGASPPAPQALRPSHGSVSGRPSGEALPNGRAKLMSEVQTPVLCLSK